MEPSRRPFLVALASLALMGAVIAAGTARPDRRAAAATPAPMLPGDLPEYPDASGAFRTVSSAGPVDLHNPFFQSLGVNGRACVNCHQPRTGWTLTPASVTALFDATGGTAPLFRPIDGAVSPTADVATVGARRAAYRLLLSKALIRIHLPVPKDAEFTLASVDDPYHHAGAADLSLFRRPLPTTNLGFLSSLMWDGRESRDGRSLTGNLLAQGRTAVSVHEQAVAGRALDPARLRALVAFEAGLYTAQTRDDMAGDLASFGGGGGPQRLVRQPFYYGINDSMGRDPSGVGFDRRVFRLYGAWDREPGPRPAQFLGGMPPSNPAEAARQAVARGERLFNNRPILIVGVPGLNDVQGATVLRGACTTCHDSPNVGGHSVPALMNLGLANASRRTPDLPLYWLRRRTTGQLVGTTDPGRALVTGQWADIGKFKVPDLRGLAARAPYFHNGSAATLNDVVDFYDTRFGMGLRPDERADLVAFLRSL